MFSAVGSAVVVLGCVLAITSTYRRISQTWDEPNHIATGVEWLQHGTYQLWTENPPLARVAVGLGPFMVGARLPGDIRAKMAIKPDGAWASYPLGNHLLYDYGSYRRQLSLARAGTLPFFILAATVLWLWLRRSPFAAFVAVAAFCTLPPILAHSGQATTDVAFTAVFLLFVWQLIAWLESGTASRSAALGACLGLTVATKFTALVFVPAASVAIVAARLLSQRRLGQPLWLGCRRRLKHVLLIAAPVAALVVWAAYRFSVGRMADLHHQPYGFPIFAPEAHGARAAIAGALAYVRLPAPEFWHGLLFLFSHQDAGHQAFAHGHVSQFGFWYFYPLALLVKTPFPFLIFLGAGCAAAVRYRKEIPWWVWGVLGSILLILLCLMRSNVNIGLRHVLAVYALAAVGVAAALVPAMRDVRRGLGRVLTIGLGALLAWQVGAAGSAHPDFLTYFNPVAARDPGAWLADSDLDWGQGVFELERYFAQHPAESLHVAYNGSARLCAHSLPKLVALRPQTPVRGWVAISELYYREVPDFLRVDPPCDMDSVREHKRTKEPWYAWLRGHEPLTILGRTVRVYHVE